ncbi:hypothetical protein VUN82_01085 [Micrococcaceae bacterium Sec5.1]
MNAEPWGTPERHGKLDQRQQATDRFRTGNVSLNSLWTYYFGIGGDADELVLDAYLNGLLVLAPGQMELVDTAFRELTADGRTEPAGQQGRGIVRKDND